MTKAQTNIAIRLREPQDDAAIAAVVRAAFGSHAEVQLVEALRRDGDCVCELVALGDDDSLTGHIFFSRLEVTSASQFLRAAALAPLAVRRIFSAAASAMPSSARGSALAATPAADSPWSSAIPIITPASASRPSSRNSSTRLTPARPSWPLNSNRAPSAVTDGKSLTRAPFRAHSSRLTDIFIFG
jgi:hypothetical protein